MNKTHIIDQSYAGHRLITSTGDTWIIEQGVTGYAGGSIALDEGDSLIDNTLVLHGKLETTKGGIGLLAEGTRTHIEISKFGSIIGDIGAKMTGLEQTLVNNGLISADTFALTAGGPSVKIINNGTLHGEVGTSVHSYQGTFINNGSISGYTAISIGGEDFKLTLKQESVVSGEREAVEAFGEEGTKIRIVNDGVLSGGDRGMSLFHADFTVVNRGEINGDVVTFGGNSTFDFRGGILNGAIHGGNGDDTYLLSSKSTEIIEHQDGGLDTIRSTISYDLSSGVNNGQEIEALRLLGKKNINATGSDQYNDLRGNAGSNILSGNGGIDTLFGGKGNDDLFGGSGLDYFTFRKGAGHDVVKDYAADMLDLTQWNAITSFKDMMEHHVHFEGGDMIISAGDDSLTLENVTKADLVSSHVYF